MPLFSNSIDRSFIYVFIVHVYIYIYIVVYSLFSEDVLILDYVFYVYPLDSDQKNSEIY